MVMSENFGMKVQLGTDGKLLYEADTGGRGSIYGTDRLGTICLDRRR